MRRDEALGLSSIASSLGSTASLVVAPALRRPRWLTREKAAKGGLGAGTVPLLCYPPAAVASARQSSGKRRPPTCRTDSGWESGPSIIGLPIVAVLAWAYEITPEGVVLEDGGSRGLRLPRKRAVVAPAVVAGVALMAIVTGYAWWRSIDRTAEPGAGDFDPGPQSIGVLAFGDMSPSAESAYLGDGLSEELSSDLARLPGLRVAARTSAFAFKGRDLDVRYVLEGSVRREGDRVRVTAQLIDAKTGFHAWTDSYDRPWQDLISIQRDISGAIARQLHAVLTPEAAQQLEASRTLDPRAYDFYLAGIARLRQGGSVSGVDEAESLFRRSLAEDPGFTRAQAGLCQLAIMRYDRTGATDQIHLAETECRRALEADPTLKETELALARLYVASGRQEQAEAVYRSLLRRAPGDAELHIGLGRTFARSNRPKEAEQSFREAILVEPGYWLTYNALGGFLFEVGRGREAAEACRHASLLAEKSLAVDATDPETWVQLGYYYGRLGDQERARRYLARALELGPEWRRSDSSIARSARASRNPWRSRTPR